MLNELNNIARLKEELIIRKRELLQSNVAALQKKVYADLFDKVIAILDTEGGAIISSDDNLARVAAVDKMFKDFEKDIAATMTSVTGTYLELLSINEDYFALFKSSLFDAAAKKVEEAMRARIGITARGALQKDGFIDGFIKDRSIARTVKQQVLSAVTNGTPISTLTKGLNAFIQGTADGAPGAIDAHFRTYIYDTYSQFDRENSNVFAIELDLNYMVYAGGLVEHSREFCIQRNGRVFTRTEVSRFGTPRDLFAGYTNKSKGEFAGKNKNYIPERDLGGYNCGHTGNWVSYEIARSLRPDIPKYKAAA